MSILASGFVGATPGAVLTRTAPDAVTLGVGVGRGPMAFKPAGPERPTPGRDVPILPCSCDIYTDLMKEWERQGRLSGCEWSVKQNPSRTKCLISISCEGLGSEVLEMDCGEYRVP